MASSMAKPQTLNSLSFILIMYQYLDLPFVWNICLLLGFVLVTFGTNVTTVGRCISMTPSKLGYHTVLFVFLMLWFLCLCQLLVPEAVWSWFLMIFWGSKSIVKRVKSKLGIPNKKTSKNPHEKREVSHVFFIIARHVSWLSWSNRHLWSIAVWLWPFWDVRSYEFGAHAPDLSSY